MAKPKKNKAGKRERRERRFSAQTSTNPLIVRGLNALGAAALGAGTWGLVGKQWMTNAESGIPYSAWVAALGFVLLGIGVWLGTVTDAAIRVGDPGIAEDKGELKRIPWWGIKKISWDADTASLVVRGEQESGGALSFTIRRAVHPDALAWILKEANDRVEDLVDVPEGVQESLPKASVEAGQVLKLDPVQVVGRHCAESDEAIAYEPDGRVCWRCERVYHKAHVPEECACGTSLANLRKKADDDDKARDDDAPRESTKSKASGEEPLAEQAKDVVNEV
jgi:hypothetical protein